MIVVDRDTCTDYELFAAYPHDGGGRWTAGSGAIFNLRSNHLRPAGWTSADAAGPADPARPRPLRRGRRRVDRPRAAVHRAVHGAALRVSRAPRGIHLPRAEPAADGAARPPEGERQHLAGCPTRRASSPRRSSATG